MLKNILSDNEVESSIGKCLLFKVLAAITRDWMSVPKTQLQDRIETPYRIGTAGLTCARSSVTGRTFVNSKIAPIGIPFLDNVHQRSFTRDRAASIAEIVVSKPWVARRKRNLGLADRTPSVISENNRQIIVRTCGFGRWRIPAFRPLECLLRKIVANRGGICS